MNRCTPFAVGLLLISAYPLSAENISVKEVVKHGRLRRTFRRSGRR